VDNVFFVEVHTKYFMTQHKPASSPANSNSKRTMRSVSNEGRSEGVSKSKAAVSAEQSERPGTQTGGAC
jgi:hypothetical protein